MRIRHDFGEGSKLYDVRQFGSAYHFRQTEQQPNGLWRIVMNTTEYKVGDVCFRELFGKRPRSGTVIFRGN